MMQSISISQAERTRVEGWRVDCANVLDESATSSRTADQDQASAATEPGYLFEGQLSQVGKQNACNLGYKTPDTPPCLTHPLQGALLHSHMQALAVQCWQSSCQDHLQCQSTASCCISFFLTPTHHSFSQCLRVVKTSYPLFHQLNHLYTISQPQK